MQILKSKRHELQYIISDLEAIVLQKRLDKILKRDKFCENGPYTITSLYFDDVMNTAIKEKINGERVRHKFRIRYYNNDTSFLKLERKSKTDKCKVIIHMLQI